MSAPEIPSLVEKVGGLEGPLGELHTAVEALHFIADEMGRSAEGTIVRFLACHFESAYKKVYAAFEAANSAVYEEKQAEIQAMREHIRPVKGHKP